MYDPFSALMYTVTVYRPRDVPGELKLFWWSTRSVLTLTEALPIVEAAKLDDKVMGIILWQWSMADGLKQTRSYVRKDGSKWINQMAPIPQVTSAHRAAFQPICFDLAGTDWEAVIKWFADTGTKWKEGK